MPTSTPIASQTPASTIPILDIGAYLAGDRGSLERTGSELRWIAEDVGVFYVTNHGVRQELIDAAFAQAERFHAQPLSEKMLLHTTEETDVQGYLPMRAGTPSSLPDGRKPNANEAFFLRREPAVDEPQLGTAFHLPNRWPNLPGFRDEVLAYYKAVEKLAKSMLPLYAEALNLPPHYFDSAFEHPIGTLRLTHYPPFEYGDDEYAIGPHTDNSFLTILAQHHVPGLQVLREGTEEWLDAPIQDGAFVVNSGDIIRRLTNDRFCSIRHRAYNRSGSERYAIPYFFHPHSSYVLDCVPGSVDEDHPRRYDAMTAGDFVLGRTLGLRRGGTY